MRKQYHLWPTECGLAAWDVERLIRLTQDLPRERVAPGKIRELDEVYWFDDRGRGQCRVPATWRVLYKDGDSWNPVSAPGPAGCERNRFNAMSFDAVAQRAGDFGYDLVLGVEYLSQIEIIIFGPDVIILVHVD